MTKRIFKYTELIIVITLIAGFAALLAILYGYFGNLQHNQLSAETELAAQALKYNQMDYLKSLDIKGTRVTWIDHDGRVLYDNEADPAKMENHAGRPEVQAALRNGHGESTRYSKTLTTQMLYSAKRLDDGTVLRISETRRTMLTIALGMIVPMLWVLGILLILTWFISSRAARKIVQPLNHMNLDQPLENAEYPELAPFLRRIDTQQREIIEQKESLARAEKDFLAVSENMDEGLILLTEKGTILTINQKAMSLLHTDPDAAGQDILIYERRHEFEMALRKAAAGEHSELKLTINGRIYQIDISPVSGETGTAGMVVLLFDVTERENAEAMRREFTGNVSHELKTPLHTISGCAELLEQGGVRPEDRKKFVHVIYKQAQRMISLVEDILYISHLDEGAGDMEQADIDLFSAAQKEADTLRQTSLDKQVTITVDGDHALVRGVPRLVESIINNLIDNAVKYNRCGGKVNVNIEDLDESVKFVVKDTGIGIPQEDLPRIFERFYRVDKSHSREIGGTGLGLSIVKHAAMILNADVNVESTPDVGTTFTVTFPKKPVL